MIAGISDRDFQRLITSGCNEEEIKQLNGEAGPWYKSIGGGYERQNKSDIERPNTNATRNSQRA